MKKVPSVRNGVLESAQQGNVQIFIRHPVTMARTTTSVREDMFRLFVASIAQRLRINDRSLAEKVARREIRNAVKSGDITSEIHAHIFSAIVDTRVANKRNELYFCGDVQSEVSCHQFHQK